ncbi:Protein PRY1 [Orchesella cincta]|uniref:Protein PRY1 n=1 Tax=Orchesella cincta TaxID=48709 RepID=A0A1D2ME74_ORCCI|nr:Protein PRY1 [Orchesella cincta]
MKFKVGISSIKQSLYIFIATFFLNSECFAEEITFFEHSNYEGESIKFTRTNSDCANLPGNWNDRISSVDTHGNCIVVWEHGGCSGKSERIAPGTRSHNHLAAIGFNDQISSYQLCSKSGSGPRPPGPPSSGLSGVRRVAVDEHNTYRRRHRSPDIRGDNEEIHRTAQRYAEYLANNDKFEHSGGKYGENLAGTGGGNQEEAVRNAVRMWYNEEPKYDYNNTGFSMETGHFTAVVWKSTTHVGIGVAWNPKSRWWVVVANYDPPGNFGGQYRENVFPPS